MSFAKKFRAFLSNRHRSSAYSSYGPSELDKLLDELYESELRKESDQREALAVEGFREMIWKHLSLPGPVINGKETSRVLLACDRKLEEELLVFHPNHAATKARIERESILAKLKSFRCIDQSEQLGNCECTLHGDVEGCIKDLEALQDKEEG